MKRRTVLAAVGVSLSGSGCLATGSSRSGGTATGTTSNGTAQSATRSTPACATADARRVTLVEAETLPSSLDLSMTASIAQGQVASKTPPQLAVKLTNRGDRRDVFPRGGRCHPFNRVRGGSDPPGIWAYRSTDSPDERVPNCWTKATSHPGPGTPTARAFPSYRCTFATLDSGETRTWRYELWDDSLVDGYYPTGRYRFSTVVKVSDADDGSDDFSTAPEHEWGLDLRVSRTDA